MDSARLEDVEQQCDDGKKDTTIPVTATVAGHER
jgi:hypothetical protein